TAVAARRFVAVEVRLFGKVGHNEITMSHITARFPGRIDRLFVNYTGMSVAKGDKIAEVYGPELLVAQQEVFQALKLKQGGAGLGEVGERTLASVREKFRYWGFPDTEVDDIIARGEVSQRLTIRAPISGIVVEKNVVEGRYFDIGDALFTISDLRTVWINLDAFEIDIPWLRYGQEVRFETDASPGRVYKGRVAFIQPVLDETSRTVKVRLNAENLDGSLRPGTFVRAVLRARFADDGTLIEPSLSGKWISPMHPEIVKDKPGKCDICGVDLVDAASLGMAVTERGFRAPLVIPESAPLLAGRRAVVYVETGKGVYEGREVVLGPKAGGHYVVKSGLEEGDRVVVKGAFKIDSSLQLLARPSMMSQDGNDESGANDRAGSATLMHSVPREFAESLRAVHNAYFTLQKSLAGDDFANSAAAARELVQALDGADGGVLDAYASEDWDELGRRLRFSALRVRDSGDIADARAAFLDLSAAMELLVLKFGSDRKVYKMHCPMAFDDKGADWLQDDEHLLNPYYGAVMLRCGVNKGELGTE
ncbi:MAG: efflux RND transporter periplasmic adaptor subunit, partial [Victivallales bacterium]|nr:efflux RND transporter periplasmic adaptor subunit [Victivallales bacterium]